MLKYMAMAALLAFGPGAAMAQEMSDDRWQDVRGFLEENPGIMSQLSDLMDQPSAAEQALLDEQNIELNAEALFENAGTPVLGNPEGEVVIVKFSDYSCGHCRTMNGTLASLIEGDDRIQVRIMEFPILGERSQLAARFALAVKKVGGDEAYHVAHDALFSAGRNLTARTLRNIANAAGVDVTQTLGAMDDPDIIAQLEEAIQLGQAMNITGTPGLVIGEVVVRGAVPEDVMASVIDEYYPASQ